jgi:N utilization substance protein B
MTHPERDPTKRTARRKARKRALDILYEADLRGTEPLATARDRLAQSDPPVPDYALTLVEGVTARRARIDELLATYSEGWTLDRMPPVDRNLLRIATYELLFRDDVPDVVAIDEAVELAKELSTDESPRFVNGLLGRLQLLKAELAG